MIHHITLFVLFSFLYFYNLGLNEIWMPNEALTADGVRDMLEGGSLLSPQFNGEPFLHKPPLTHWLAYFGSLIFGLGEFGIRFFHAILGVLGGIVTALFAREIFDLRTSLLAGLIFLSSVQILANARTATPEIPFTFFILLTLYFWFLGYSRRKDLFIILGFLSSSFGMLTKWVPGFLIPASIWFIYLLFTDPREVLRKVYIYGSLLAFLPFSLWFLYMVSKHGDPFLEMFYYENIKRIYGIQSDPFYLHIVSIPATFFPYSFLVYMGTIWGLKRRELLLFNIWFLEMLLVFSLIKMKLPTYMMPAFPAMSIITAHFLCSAPWKKVVVWSVRALLIIGGVSVIGMAALTVVELPYLLLSLLLIPVSFFMSRDLRPAMVGLSLALYSLAVSLPYLESFRHQKEIGSLVKQLDPEKSKALYLVGSHFFESLPFYAERKVIQVSDLKSVNSGSFFLAPRNSSSNCLPLWKGKLYTGSEGRFFKFLLDLKKGRRLKEYILCVKSP